MATTVRVGDYVLFPAFATGGTATIHLGRLVRGIGFERLVVIKRLHARLASESGALERLLREARVASRVRSPYVIPTLDVLDGAGELCLVMEFVHGVTLGRLLGLSIAERRPLAPAVVVAIVGHVLRGLHAAHEATSEEGEPLELVHRDISPQNVLVGADGLARVLDFGIAKALGHKSATASSEIRGTLAYMAPEQVRGGMPVTRQADLYSVGVLLWECLTGQRLRATADVEALVAAFGAEAPAPSAQRPELSPALDAVVLRALRRDPVERFPSAQAMLGELEAAIAPASTDEVAAATERLGFDDLERLRELVAKCERSTFAPPAIANEEPQRGTASMPAKGSLLAGKYRIEDVLGSGAMGVVLGAHDETNGRPVAIKVLHADRTEDERAAQRMLREARAAQRLRGEHVVRVLDVQAEDGLVYLVMERLVGRDLRALLDEHSRLDVAVAVLYALQACEALAEAHALGIVHRDLKPANIFLSRAADGGPLVKVLDFGIAKVASGDDDSSRSLTASSVVIGSPAYMSPEQIRSPKDVDARSDVWALAVLLYELLTGRLPFAGDNSAAIIASISADAWIPIRSIRTDVPRELELTLERCLAKDTRARTPSMFALATELAPFAPEGYAATERIHRAAGRPSPGQKKRPPLRTALAAGAALATMTVVVVGIAARVRSPEPPRETSHSVQATTAPVTPEPTPPPVAPPMSAAAATATTARATTTASTGTGPTRRVAPRARPTAHGTREAAAVPSQTASTAPPAVPVPKLDPTAEFR